MARLLLELFAIVLGVLLALAADEWWTERELDARVEGGRERLLQELALNYAELRKHHGLVAGRLEQLRGLADSIDDSAAFRAHVGKFGGYNWPDIKDTTWRSLNARGLADRMDMRFVEDVYFLYEFSQLAESTSGPIADLTFSPTFHDPAQATIAYHMSLALMDQQVDWAQIGIEAFEDFERRYGLDLVTP